MTIKEYSDALFKLFDVMISWPTILLVIILIFRRHIIQLMNDLNKRLTEANLEISKFKLSLKTTKTPIGETDVSVQETKPTKDINEGIFCTYTSSQYKFKISWPKGWIANIDLDQATISQFNIPPPMNIPIIITKTDRIGDFRPNINITVEDCSNITVDQYMHISTQKMKELGWKIYSSEIDENSHSGLLVYSQVGPLGRIFQFARMVLRNGLAFVVTASELPSEEQLTAQTSEELLNILNSFKLIV